MKLTALGASDGARQLIPVLGGAVRAGATCLGCSAKE